MSSQNSRRALGGQAQADQRANPIRGAAFLSVSLLNVFLADLGWLPYVVKGG